MIHQRYLRECPAGVAAGIRTLLVTVSALCCVFALHTGAEEGHAHGQTRLLEDATLQAWNAQAQEWVSPEAFWQAIAELRGGLRWGRALTYPPYAQVRERDLLIIELEQGPCLMEFWHRRWRRAQDVRRWSNAFNDYGGCPYVFD